MDITELEINDRRNEIAFESFESGESIVFEGVRLQVLSNGVLEVNSYSDYTNPSQVSSQMAREGISRSKKVLGKLCEVHPKYNPIIEPANKEYYYCCDYHTGAVALAREISGEFKWLLK